MKILIFLILLLVSGCSILGSSRDIPEVKPVEVVTVVKKAPTADELICPLVMRERSKSCTPAFDVSALPCRMRVTRAIITFMPVKPDIPNHCICFMQSKTLPWTTPLAKNGICRASPCLWCRPANAVFDLQITRGFYIGFAPPFFDEHDLMLPSLPVLFWIHRVNLCHQTMFPDLSLPLATRR